MTRVFKIADAEQAAFKLMQDGQTFFQSFQCSDCGARLVMVRANRLYRNGECDSCEKVSRIEECSLVVVLKGGVE